MTELHNAAWHTARTPAPRPPANPDGRRRGITRADVMCAAEVAVLLGVPKSTVEDWARRGILPSRKRGRRRLFLRWEVEDWLVADD